MDSLLQCLANGYYGLNLGSKRWEQSKDDGCESRGSITGAISECGTTTGRRWRRWRRWGRSGICSCRICGGDGDFLAPWAVCLRAADEVGCTRGDADGVVAGVVSLEGAAGCAASIIGRGHLQHIMRRSAVCKDCENITTNTSHQMCQSFISSN